MTSRNVYIEVVGYVPRDFIEYVKMVLAEFYGVVGKVPEILEVHVYESTELMTRRLVNEASSLGIPVVGCYIVSHDAWMGWPRIHIDYEKSKALDLTHLRALLLHEAAHSVLHGSLSSYIIMHQRDLVKMLGNVYYELLYLASTVIKDMEVHKFLVDHGFVDAVEDYYWFISYDIRGVGCSDLKEVLILAKLLSPCLYIQCEPGIMELMSKRCRDIHDSVLDVLRRISTLSEDLTTRVNKLIELLYRLNACSLT